MMLACKEGHGQVVKAILDDLSEQPGLLSELYRETEEEKNMNCLELAIEGGHVYVIFFCAISVKVIQPGMMCI